MDLQDEQLFVHSLPLICKTKYLQSKNGLPKLLEIRAAILPALLLGTAFGRVPSSCKVGARASHATGACCDPVDVGARESAAHDGE